MVRIELEPDEAMLLQAILASYLADLRMEIADTDSLDYRDKLKGEKLFIQGLLAQLELYSTPS